MTHASALSTQHPTWGITVPAARKLDPKDGWRHEAIITIKPCSAFPIDMLRYDACWPASQGDVAKIAGLGRRNGAAEEHPQRVQIRLVRHSASKVRTGWTVDRWRSFGCEIFCL